MIPTREEAMEFLRDGLACNPGPWGRHCLTAAHCSRKNWHMPVVIWIQRKRTY